jgi:long-chain acyl-CoA synthetase
MTPIIAPSETTLTIAARFANGDRPAIHHGEHCYDWAWLQNEAQALASLLAEQGLPSHARAALVARNRPHHVAALLAQLARSAPTQMVYSAQSNTAIVADLELVDAPVILADEGDWSMAMREMAERSGAVGIALARQAEPVLITPRAAKSSVHHRHDSDDIFAIQMLTSGTTGKPKRSSLSWSALDAVVADAKGVYEDPGTAQKVPPPAIVIHPLGNVSGVNYVAGPLLAGQPIVLFERFELESWVNAVETFRPQRGALPPAGLRMVYDADVPPERLSSLVAIGTGGGPLDAQLKADFEARYDLAIFPGYGATEFGGVIASWTLELHREFGVEKAGSCGRARPGVALRVVGEDGAILPPGQIGTLHARVERIGDGWIVTTDLAALDADGFLFLHGRSDGAIIRGGFKVQPDAVAATLRTHPDVADAVVIGKPDARLGEVPVAAVEPRAGQTPSVADIREFARKRLLAFQVPAEIVIVSKLPRNASMKIPVADVRALFEC